MTDEIYLSDLRIVNYLIQVLRISLKALLIKTKPGSILLKAFTQKIKHLKL
jgi:hypothetical protein